MSTLYVCVYTTVYGFFNDSVVQPERGQGYMVRVGYIKGGSTQGATTLLFDVQDTAGTASKLKLLFNNQFLFQICTITYSRGRNWF